MALLGVIVQVRPREVRVACPHRLERADLGQQRSAVAGGLEVGLAVAEPLHHGGCRPEVARRPIPDEVVLLGGVLDAGPDVGWQSGAQLGRRARNGMRVPLLLERCQLVQLGRGRVDRELMRHPSVTIYILSFFVLPLTLKLTC